MITQKFCNNIARLPDNRYRTIFWHLDRPKQLAIGVEKHALRIVGAWFVNNTDMCGVAARIDVIMIGNDRQLLFSVVVLQLLHRFKPAETEPPPLILSI